MNNFPEDDGPDLSVFAIRLPRLLWVDARPDRIVMFRSPLVVDEHPAVRFVLWFAQSRNLVAAELDASFPEAIEANAMFGTGTEGCLGTLYVTPQARLSGVS